MSVQRSKQISHVGLLRKGGKQLNSFTDSPLQSSSPIKVPSQLDCLRDSVLFVKQATTRKSKIPASATKLTSYKELTEYAEAFAKGGINLLILIGDGGLAKSTTFQDCLHDDTCWISGYGMPFSIYMKLFRYRDKLVVLDDLDNLYAKQDGITLLKCLCQTEPEKTVAWLSSAKALDQQNVPREFVTRSKVAIITNEWQTLDRNVAALEDRGHVLWFAPSPFDIHRQVRPWFKDDEIYEWFEDNLHLIPNPSMRMYFKAEELKKMGLPWKQVGQEDPQQKRKKTVLELLADDDFETLEERAIEFVNRGAGCRSTFFNYLKVVRPS